MTRFRSANTCGAWCPCHSGSRPRGSRLAGTFIARTARGRTPREFILGAMSAQPAWCYCGSGFSAATPSIWNSAPRTASELAGIMELVRDANYEAALHATIDRMTDIGWSPGPCPPRPPPACDVVRYVLRLRHPGHHRLAQHGRRSPPSAFPHRLGARRRRGGCRAPAGRPSPGLSDLSNNRRPASERRAVVHERRTAQVPGAGSSELQSAERMTSTQSP